MAYLTLSGRSGRHEPSGPGEPPLEPPGERPLEDLRHIVHVMQHAEALVGQRQRPSRGQVRPDAGIQVVGRHDDRPARGLARIGRASAPVMDAGPRGMQHEWRQR